MSQAERLGAILEKLSGTGSVTVADMAGEFGVSTATIRRDLKLLASQRLLARTHGGAMARGVAYELTLQDKGTRHLAAKEMIAEEAASRVSDGLAIGLTGGTTTTQIAKQLVERQNLTVVTNALNIASQIAIRPNVKLVVTGGVARSESYELVGPIAQASLAGINLDVVFVGTDGISPDAGLTTHHEVEAHTNRTLIDRAQHVVVVADSSKIGRVAFARICRIEEIHELITDKGADPTITSRLEEAGVSITLV